MHIGLKLEEDDWNLDKADLEDDVFTKESSSGEKSLNELDDN